MNTIQRRNMSRKRHGLRWQGLPRQRFSLALDNPASRMNPVQSPVGLPRTTVVGGPVYSDLDVKEQLTPYKFAIGVEIFMERPGRYLCPADSVLELAPAPLLLPARDDRRAYNHTDLITVPPTVNSNSFCLTSSFAISQLAAYSAVRSPHSALGRPCNGFSLPSFIRCSMFDVFQLWTLSLGHFLYLHHVSTSANGATSYQPGPKAQKTLAGRNLFLIWRLS